MSTGQDLRGLFGGVDVYLFDQLLKGRLRPPMRVLDAGCGPGRNLPYFLRSGFDVCAVDLSPEAVAATRALAASLAPRLPEENFRLEPVEEMSFKDGSFDAVISSAVLHFAKSEAQWRAMLAEMWRVLKPVGLFFARLSSTSGMEGEIEPTGGGLYRMPGGGEWFLTDERMMLEATEELGGELAEPLKTVVVHGVRSMAVWCARKL
jgi:tellurite methyltransferase